MTSCNVGHEVNKVLSNDFVTVHDVYVCSYSNFFIIVTFRHYNFELWTEGKRILHNMDLADALSAFLHLVFTFNLKYPQVCTHFELIVNQSFQCCFFKESWVSVWLHPACGGWVWRWRWHKNIQGQDYCREQENEVLCSAG